ncbi:hypothetical protein HPB51_021352 [Rhipicephalus microplus]|uniref:Carboxylesterase type B domain-containing protein n=1 Tax=Rhipicephalus microplus TaxID=6941 RepID=A0A9J6F868_RHIMP|nr:hypothetical protein HPB51_021352 [Rhipicephalus microplus]
MLKTVVVALSTDWFQTGHLADYQDSWRRMAAYGDVVVVALNVRLGALGYLRTPMKEAPGNAAFTDVAVALSWVHTNVGAFYGDHTQMVAVGLGGGGLLLAMDLLADERPAPYFKRHVIHGLSPMSLLPRSDVADACILAKNLGCLVDSSTFTEEILSCLKGRDYEDLVRASQMVGNLGFVPSREDKPLSVPRASHERCHQPTDASERTVRLQPARRTRVRGVRPHEEQRDAGRRQTERNDDPCGAPLRSIEWDRWRR